MPYRIEVLVWRTLDGDEEWALLQFKPRKKGRFEDRASADAKLQEIARRQPHLTLRATWTER